MAVLCVVCILGIPLADLGIKYYIEKNVERGSEKPCLGGKFIRRHVRNEGMALNLLDRYPKAVRLISAAAAAVTALYFLLTAGKKGRGLEKISLSFLLGGAISNLYDRIVRKYVVDYFGIKTKWKKFTDITFNLGDLFIFAGAAGLSLLSIFRRK